ncbi:NAD(P)/FAD-dependent oxidoreductase [Actinoallomurus purpureus]|uniref:dihydrolipoyl dehydrogenase family protein n=1 Tax=Actinoallomurus purpureus TaxID=478114 RepID=UPI0020929CDF|nr:NAD(P)/FAD-dependent oxidoreductase [Actinoallomurus purpureus]MCO6009283.1 NAD(P)/FAD-dependent oxidoreductase [Actinoallomurus purpureus]
MDVDVIVIGLGPGGEEVAGSLAAAGLAVVGIEDRLVGGECPYWGCIPSKMMIRAADLIAEGHRIPGMAGEADVRPSWAPVARRVREATDGWDDKVAADRFTGKGGTLVRGKGRITGPGEVTVEGQVFRARKGIVISNGTAPSVPPIEGLRDTPYWTNREAIETTEVPESLIVLGGGAIGSELAQVFARFGSRVTVVEALPRLLALEEPESSELLRKVFENEGIAVRTGAKVERVRHDGDGFVLNDDLRAERLLVATGRRTDLKALGVAAAGLDENARFVDVDERMRAADGIWAVGDVTGKGAFTHVSVYQARIVVREILGQDGPPADYRALPRVTFTDPEIGAVGLTEQQARDQGLDVRVHHTDISVSARGWIHKAEGFLKLIEHDGVLIGATSAGPVGGEVLSALAVAIHGEVPVERLRNMIYAYPTFHRAIEAALL